MTQDPAITVQDNPQAGRFEARVGEHLAIAAYRRVGDALMFTHTEVPEALEGQGVGSRLVHDALAEVRARGLQVIPMCPFVAAYIRRHPEDQDLVQPQYRARLGL
ncbi:hypothetical protein Dcar01_03773 [Deinococcus carri]|uniref:N-acetyltransferase domain-containing protein n=1 Tax=Deinococcus carri TaxID=1211323 RepID=A0ABP9WCF0_9DEIO